MTTTRAPEKAPNAKRGAARPDMPFIVCGGCGKRLRSTADGYPRAHECGLPAATNARYVAELWGTTDEESGDPALRLWSAQYFEAWRAKARATTRMRATAGAPVRWVKVIEVRDTSRGAERTGRVWMRDPYTDWQEMPAQTCDEA